MQLAHPTTLKWPPASHIWELTALTMPGANSHIIGQSHLKEPLQWRRDWEHWDASYNSKSTGRTSQDKAPLKWRRDSAHWDTSCDSKSTGRASHWTENDAEGRPKLKEESVQMKRKPNQITYRITNQSQYPARDRNYTGTEPQWQLTITMMQKSLTEQRNFKRWR